MNQIPKLNFKVFFWILSTYWFALLAHYSPAGGPGNGWGPSALETFSILFAMTFFFGFPVLVYLWARDEDRQ